MSAPAGSVGLGAGRTLELLVVDHVEQIRLDGVVVLAIPLHRVPQLSAELLRVAKQAAIETLFAPIDPDEARRG